MSNNRTVNVRQYTRKDGTPVRAHVRGAPAAAAGGGGLLLLIIALFFLGQGGSHAAPSTGNTLQAPVHPSPVVKLMTSSDAMPCVAHSYGEVRQFFRDHRCRDLHRALFEVRDGSGDEMLVAASRTAMANSTVARELQQLVGRYGTGNVTELTKSGIRFTGQHYESTVIGSTVVIAEAEPLVGHPRSAALAAAAHDSLAAVQH